YVVEVQAPDDGVPILSDLVRTFGWYPTSGIVAPPIGSNPIAIEGYKTISFEIWEQLGRVPDWVAVPTCYGDGLIGTWKGWHELRACGLTTTTPRMLAA